MAWRGSPDALIAAGIVGAVALAACYVGPAVASMVDHGAGSLARLAGRLPLKAIAAGWAGISLGAIGCAWWQLYLHPLPRHGEDGQRFAGRLRSRRCVLWIATAFVTLTLLLPLYRELLVPLVR